MGIVVQHQPPLTALSELAFQTGQLQYRNQRRRELEAQQLAQAQMAQKERLAQMQVMSNTQSQMRGHQQGMQRLAYQNMMGQQGQQSQHQLQMIQNAERAKQQRELANVYGENNVQAANVASENRMFERQQSAIKDMYDNVLNQQGQEALHGLLGQQQELQMSPDISPEEKQQQMEQIEQQIFQLREDPSMTLGRDQMPGHVRRKDDIYEEVRQADGNYIPRVRTTRSVTLPDGSIVTENIPIEEIRAKTDKVEPIEGTDEVRVSRYNEATDLVHVTTHKSNKLTPEQELKQKQGEQAAIKQVYDAYGTYKDAQDAALRAYDEAISMGRTDDEPSLVAPDDALSFTDWINSKDGILQKEMLKRAGIDVDALTREWEFSNAPDLVGAGLLPRGDTQYNPFEGLLNQHLQQDQQPQQPQPEQIELAGNRGQPAIIQTDQWKPSNEDGSINPIPFKVDDEQSVNFQPHQSLEITLTGENDKDMIQLRNAYESWRATMFDQIMSGQKLDELRDESGRSYALGTMWQGYDVDEETNKIVKKTFLITPESIEGLLNEKLTMPDEQKQKFIADKMKTLKNDFRELYGVPWSQAYRQMEKDMYRKQQDELGIIPTFEGLTAEQYLRKHGGLGGITLLQFEKHNPAFAEELRKLLAADTRFEIAPELREN